MLEIVGESGYISVLVNLYGKWECQTPACIDECVESNLEGSPFDITVRVVTRLSLTPLDFVDLWER